ncbi:MAG: hypothetical protein J07HR59_01336 [Halorubrum sp. J07HR59]|nr:MAG: hypothetical protein J07HR59_01336 [Halorubrum sp. J07HR59]
MSHLVVSLRSFLSHRQTRSTRSIIGLGFTPFIRSTAATDLAHPRRAFTLSTLSHSGDSAKATVVSVGANAPGVLSDASESEYPVKTAKKSNCHIVDWVFGRVIAEHTQ